jgi:hypothetical protein
VERAHQPLQEQTDSGTDRTRAHTRAIFALIDRLEGGGLSPAT